MATLKFVLAWTLTFSMLFSPLVGHAEGNPPATDSTAAEKIDMAALAEQKLQEEIAAPPWVKRLRTRKVSSFFKKSLKNGTDELVPEEKAHLIEQLSALLAYFDQNDPKGEFKNLTKESIAPFVESLTKNKLSSPIRYGMVTEPIGNWTAENLLVRHMASYCTTNCFSRTFDILKKNSRGITFGSAAFLVGVGLYYLDQRYYGSGVKDALESSLIFAWKSGPVTAIMTAFTTPWIGPTTEYVTTWANRIFKPLVALINRGFNRAKPGFGSDEAQADANIAARPLEAEKDGSNFGGQSLDSQKANWAEMLDVMVDENAHATTLLRATQSAGRSYVLGSVMDLQVSANFVFSLDTNLEVQNVRAGLVLQKYEIKFHMRDETDKLKQLKSLYAKYERLCTKGWTEDLEDAQVEQLRQDLIEVMNQMKQLGIIDDDMEELWNIQRARARTVDALVSTINVNEFKRFLNAETNRNGVPFVRNMEATIYKGFQLQNFIATYEHLIPKQQHDMGLKNDGIRQPVCELLFEQRVRGPSMDEDVD